MENCDVERTFKKGMKIAVDFDGTCVSHDFPYVGYEIGAVPVLKLLNKAGARLILDTMRSREYLTPAVYWLKGSGVDLYSVGKDKTQEDWTSANKCHADLSIDDRNLGVPLLTPKAVNWAKITMMLLPFFIDNNITPDEIEETLQKVKEEQTKYLNANEEN